MLFRSDLAEPRSFVPAVEAGHVFIGREEGFLSQILGIKIVFGQLETDGKNQILIPVDPVFQLRISVNPAHLLTYLS